MTQSLFPNKYFSMSDPDDYGAFDTKAQAPPLKMPKGVRPELFYMKGIRQEHEDSGGMTAKAAVQLATFLALKRPLRVLDPTYVWRLTRQMRRIYGSFPKWRDPFSRFFHEDALGYFDTLAQFEKNKVDLSGDFVYFPLQLQPEMTTSALGGRFRDQAYAIERLSGILPRGVRILVKENPMQGGYMRGPLFFHRLKRIPSVIFLPSWANTHELTAHARFVASVTGTVGWEAICTGKPALVFGKAWYRKFPGVVEWREGLTYDEIAGTTVDHAALERAAGALLNSAHPGVVDDDYSALVPGLDPAANARVTATEVVELIERRRPLTFPPGANAGLRRPQPSGTGSVAPPAAGAVP